MNLSNELRSFILAQGATMVGYGDLGEVDEADRDGYHYGISIGVALGPEIVAGIHPGPSLAYGRIYNEVNVILDGLARDTANFLQDKGHGVLAKTLKITKSDPETRRTKLPHKTVATRSGLGWIGKCAMLVTPEYGSAIRFTSVLTDAALETANPVNSSRCGSCRECQRFCPAKAVSGRNWELGLDRDEFFDAFACRRVSNERGEAMGMKHGACGLCIWACPWTRRYLKRQGAI
jgi:epoxyqueuosine reductase